jgi:long-chain acyl-CoA synthetase
MTDPAPSAIVPADPRLPSSPFLADWLFFHAERQPGAPAVASPTARLTYAELAERVRVLAGDLAGRGIGPGSRVLMALHNTPATVVAGLAINALGATSVEVSPEWNADVLGDIVARSGTRHIVVAVRDATTWAKALVGREVEHAWAVHGGALPRTFGDALGQFPATLVLEDGRLDPLVETQTAPAAVGPEPERPALILYTSGSTGRPHGVIQTFGNVDANTRSIVQYLGLTAEDRALLTLPLYYCYGRSVLQTHILVGGSIVLDSRMAFPRVVMETMAAEGCTGFAGVPLTFEMLRRQVDIASIHFSRLRYLTQAGGAMALDTIAWAREAFHPAHLFVMYGQTEATARLSYLPPERAENKVGSIGIPIPGVELRVVDVAGHELPPGEVGELIAHGANVTPGYLDEPAETAEILRGGWLWTGDLAERDSDGFLYYRGRAKEILKIGGHRVSPIEIEQVIARHPDVAEAAVIGLPDPLLGQAPGAVVVPRAGTALGEADLQRFCRERLPAHQVPVRFAFVDSLPRNESGKLLRAELAAWYVTRM